MGDIRNGARTFLDVANIACKLSHMRGFRGGLTKILGPERATDVYAVWTPFCLVIEDLVVIDNNFNRIDYRPETTGDEDRTPEPLV